MALFGKLFGFQNPVETTKPIVGKINSLEREFEQLSREQLQTKTHKWQGELNGKEWQGQNEYLENILPEAFAAVREAAKRTLGQRHFDVQLVGGMMLHRGKIAEMKTGEGKTLAATTAVYLNALAGRGVHIITVNDYLSRRDASWMGQIYHYLGLSTAAIQHEQSFIYSEQDEKDEVITEEESQGVQIDVKNLVPCSRREAYAADILYGTNNEFGFDYLRDNMARSPSELVQRDLHYAIVDEVDSILIDEARTPLIISAPDVESTDLYREFAGFAKTLAPEDYVLEEKHRQVNFSEQGYEKLEKKYGVEIYSDIKLRHHADSALRAQTLFQKDKQYVVRGDEIVIVDEFTGRLMPGRRYSEGLHQAIEAKEGVRVQPESKTLATITFQNYFRLYQKLAGMTGTAMTEAEEFHKIYKLDVVEIPTHRPMIRADLQDSVYKTEAGKFRAIVAEIKRRHEAGQPLLVGTISIERNEHLSELLKKAGVRHEILNAKNHEREAHIIAQAGRAGAVTLATNIAGRGVDIILGGNPPASEEAEKVKNAGGLHVLGTERHEARRIDNQLRGRSGRQGDPGSSQFFISLEDELMRLFGGDRVRRMMDTLNVPEDEPIEHGLVSKAIESAQKKIEGFNFDTRKHVLEYDDVLNKQREVIYGRRRKIMRGEVDLQEQILEKIRDEIEEIVGSEAEDKAVLEQLNTIFPISDFRPPPDRSLWINDLTGAAKRSYEERKQKLTAPILREIEKIITLQAIDNFWMEHLDTMDHLRQSVRLRGYAQKDPLVEYKQDGIRLFERMLKEIDKTIVYTIYKVEVRPQSESISKFSASKIETDEKIGRNAPCPCGAINPRTGKVYKYKHCGLINAPYHQK
ncbi:MAG: preprotein translocase subunit SecA [Candidatus Doudnabacteria bacterium]|nr:preprotein translocase subunit SecA [Candidatus Doudnabacteria bacterium]